MTSGNDVVNALYRVGKMGCSSCLAMIAPNFQSSGNQRIDSCSVLQQGDPAICFQHQAAYIYIASAWMYGLDTARNRQPVLTQLFCIMDGEAADVLLLCA